MPHMLIQEYFDQSLVHLIFSAARLKAEWTHVTHNIVNSMAFFTVNVSQKVLLKRKLCWKLEDILYLPSLNNTRSAQTSHQSVMDRVAETAFEKWVAIDECFAESADLPTPVFFGFVTSHLLVFSWSKGDMYFYRQTVKQLHNEMEKEQDLNKEISAFKELKKLVNAYCSAIIQQARLYGFLEIPEEKYSEIMTSKPLHVSLFQEWTEPFTLTPQKCLFMGVDPLVLHLVLALQNHPFYCDQLLELPPQKRSVDSLNIDLMRNGLFSGEEVAFPDIFCSSPDSEFGIPEKLWRYGFLYKSVLWKLVTPLKLIFFSLFLKPFFFLGGGNASFKLFCIIISWRPLVQFSGGSYDHGVEKAKYKLPEFLIVFFLPFIFHLISQKSLKSFSACFQI